MKKRLLAWGLAALFTATLAPAIPTPTYAKTLKACEDDWKANKASIQASGKKKKDFIAECRGDTVPTTAAPAPAPQQPQATTPPAPQQTPAPAPKPARTTAAPAPRAPTAPTKAGQFATEAEAKGHCPADIVVWANTESNIYHFATSRNYGRTKAGAYMCEKETTAAGVRAAKNEKHP